jgi:myo-inositol-hexaphosphate 3-phosphohydrolase
VADDQTGDFYVAEQDIGVWRYSAEPGTATTPDSRALVLSTYLVNDGYLVPDIEGLRITGSGMADGCSITDGIDDVPWYLGPDFPHGLFVCQDNTTASFPGSTRSGCSDRGPNGSAPSASVKVIISFTR